MEPAAAAWLENYKGSKTIETIAFLQIGFAWLPLSFSGNPQQF